MGNNFKRIKINKRAGESPDQYRMWRKLVLKRDGKKCAMCGNTKCRFEIHHIKPWAGFIHLRYEVDNGVTLCPPCHRSIKGKEFVYEPIFVMHVGKLKLNEPPKDAYINSIQARYGLLEGQQNEQEGEGGKGEV